MRLSDFELFCERHQSGMFYIACNVLGDSQKAEDAVQEALFRIYRTFGKLSFRTVREERVYQSWRKAPAFRHGDISHTLLPRKEILRGLH